MQALILQTESQGPSWVLGPMHKLPEASRKGRKRTRPGYAAGPGSREGNMMPVSYMPIPLCTPCPYMALHGSPHKQLCLPCI